MKNGRNDSIPRILTLQIPKKTKMAWSPMLFREQFKDWDKFIPERWIDNRIELVKQLVSNNWPYLITILQILSIKIFPLKVLNGVPLRPELQ